MKIWAVFTENGVTQLGSDAWLPMDGRLRLEKQIVIADNKLKSLKNIHPSWNGFTFYKGNSIRTAQPASPNFDLSISGKEEK